MSNGFILDGSFAKNCNADVDLTDVHIEDWVRESGNEDSVDDDAWMIRLWIAGNGSILLFDRKQAKATVEAMQEILSRYPKPE